MAMLDGVRRGGVSARREERCGRPGLGHAERREDAVPHEVVPALTGDGGEDLAGHDVEHVVVRVGAAKARHGLGEADPVGDLAAVVVGVNHSRSPAPRPRPLRCVTRSRTVKSRVTYGSYSWNPGRDFVTGSSHESFPSSARIASAAVVNALVLDAFWKSVWASTRAVSPRVRTP